MQRGCFYMFLLFLELKISVQVFWSHLKKYNILLTEKIWTVSWHSFKERFSRKMCSFETSTPGFMQKYFSGGMIRSDKVQQKQKFKITGHINHSDWVKIKWISRHIHCTFWYNQGLRTSNSRMQVKSFTILQIIYIPKKTHSCWT